MTGVHLMMGLDSQQVIGEVAFNIGHHGVTRKLEEWMLFWLVGLNSDPQL